MRKLASVCRYFAFAGSAVGLMSSFAPAAQAAGPTGHSSSTAADAYAPIVLNSANNPANLPIRMALGTDGGLYSIASNVVGGTTYGAAAIVRFGYDGSVTPIYTSSPQVTTGYGFNSLVAAPTGGFFVTAADAGFAGELFTVSTSGQVNVLHNFSGDADGAWPGPLIRGQDGMLYGGTEGGGAGGGGVVFKVAPDGSNFSVIANFSSQNGECPTTARSFGCDPSQLALSPDGTLYVATREGGSNALGALSRIESNGSLTRVLSFAEGLNAEDGMAFGSDGNLYLATENFSKGTASIKKVSPTGAVSTLPADFSSKASHGYFFADAAGHLYGYYTYGGPFGGFSSGGLAYRVTDTGRVQALAYFGYPGSNLTSPFAAAIGGDGNWYGVTVTGGDMETGLMTAYELTLPPPAGWGSGNAPAISMSTSPQTINLGQSSTLSWTLTNTDTCSLSAPNNSSFYLKPRAVSADGSLVVKPPRSGEVTFSMTCTNNGLVTTKTAVLDVLSP